MHPFATLPRGTQLYHKTLRDSRGHPTEARVNGKAQTWVRRPDEFRLPMKWGLRTCFYITHRSAGEWSLQPHSSQETTK